MTIFSKIQSSLQQMIEATSNILNLHIEIIDSSLTRVCGTGKLKNHIGEKVSPNGIVAYLLKNKKDSKIMLTDEDRNERCKICNAAAGEKCLYKQAICSTIVFNNEVIGTLGICSFDNDDDNDFLKHSENTLMEFLNKISNIICIIIRENEIVEQVKSSNKTIAHLMNDLDETLIILDKDLKIQNMNDYCKKNFPILEENLNTDIRKIFPGLDVDFANKENKQMNYNGRIFKYQFKKIENEKKVVEKIILYIVEVKNALSQYGRGANTVNMVNINDILGQDPFFLKFKDKVVKAASTDATILLMGETGTGKELFARSIHAHSKRADKPFVVINCSAIPESLIESTLFGYEKGAFTGASPTGKDGKFIAAHKGTVFLDELEAVPLYIQTKLLRVLENKTIEKVGGVKEIKIDIRIIGATNVDLGKLVEQGKFREDLYHRLNVITLFIPALRERGQDVLFLAEHFIEMYSQRLGKKIKGMDEDLKKFFLNYPWKGNVRELKNAIEHAVSLESAQYIRKESLPSQLEMIKIKNENIKSLAELEREEIIKALTIHGHDNEGKKKAAAALGIGRATLYRKLKEYKISGD